MPKEAPEPQYYLQRDLLDRGWSRATIAKILGEPDSTQDRYGGGVIYVYASRRVRAAERSKKPWPKRTPQPKAASIDSWSAAKSMQDTRAGFAAVVIDGRIYVAGGEVLVQPSSVRDTAEVYDPSSDTWRFETKLSTPLHGVGAVAFEGKMYMFGGASNPMAATPRTGIVNIFTP